MLVIKRTCFPRWWCAGVAEASCTDHRCDAAYAAAYVAVHVAVHVLSPETVPECCVCEPLRAIRRNQSPAESSSAVQSRVALQSSRAAVQRSSAVDSRVQSRVESSSSSRAECSSSSSPEQQCRAEGNLGSRRDILSFLPSKPLGQSVCCLAI